MPGRQRVVATRRSRARRGHTKSKAAHPPARWDPDGHGEGESGLIRAIRHRSVEFAHALAGADFSSAASFRFFLVSTWSNRSLSADQLRIWLSPIVPGLCAKYRPISITLQINSALCSAPIVMPEACIPRVSPIRRGVNRQQAHDRFGPYQSRSVNSAVSKKASPIAMSQTASGVSSRHAFQRALRSPRRLSGAA